MYLVKLFPLYENFTKKYINKYLGPDPGQLSNTPMWKKTTPASFRSPFFAQGDIGTPPPLYFNDVINIEILPQVSLNIKIKTTASFFVLFKPSTELFLLHQSKI